MSTSDAAELELRVVGGETATPLCGTAGAATQATTARKHQDETFGEQVKQEKQVGDKTPAEQCSHRSAIRQDEIGEVLRLGKDGPRKDKVFSRGDSDFQIPKPIFTSHLFLRFSKNPGVDRPELKHRTNLQRIIEPQRIETKDNNVQVNGRISSSETSVEAASIYPFSKAISFPPKKEDGIVTFDCHELEITRDLSRTLSNGDFRAHKPNGLHILPSGSQPGTCTGSLTDVALVENIEDYTKCENQTDLQVQSDPSGAMLSSTVVTVLAPHWNGLLRRPKKVDGTGTSEAQGSLQDGRNVLANHAFQHTRNQHDVERVLTEGSRTQLRAPLSGLRRNTVGRSTESDPLSLDFQSKREIIHSVSLDVNSGRMDNRKIDGDTLNPLSTNASSVSQLFNGPDEQRRNPQTVHQGGHSSSSSKPITSNFLLSLRRGNSRGNNSNATSALSEVNRSTLSSVPSDQNGKLFTTPLPQSFLNNNVQERPKLPLSPSPISYRTSETGPVLSPSSSDLRERNISDRLFFSTSLTNKDAEDITFAQHPQAINRIQSNLISSRSFLDKGPSERQQNCRDSDKSTNLFSKTSSSLPRQSTYDSSGQVKTHVLPKRTTLKHTSWWKQVNQEGGSPLTPKGSNNKDKPNTTLIPPSTSSSDMTSPSQTNNKRLGSPINNNRTESVFTGNMNLFMKTQGGSHHLRQRSAEKSPDHESQRLAKEQYSSNLNNREPQKPCSVPDVLSSSKISKSTAQTTLSHSKDPSKQDVSDSSYMANVSELPPTLQNPKSSDTPTESSSKYKNNHCPPKTNNTPVSPHSMDSQKFTSTSLSLDFTSTLTHASQTTSGPQTPNTKSSLSYQSHPVSSQTSVHTSIYTTSPQTPKFSNKSAVTPLGFERSYTSIPKPFHPKTMSSLIPTVSSFSKTDYSSKATTSYSFTTDSHPVVTTASGSALLSPAVTSAITSSPTSVTVSSLLTPPATPVITSPNSETLSPKEGRKFSCSPERESKKNCPGVGKKKVRRVTWDDSVEVQCSEPKSVEKPELPQVQANPQSPSSYHRNAPSIFSFLRSNNSARTPPPVCSPNPKTSNLEVGKAGKYRSLSSDSADLAFREFERNKQRTGDAMLFNQGRQHSDTPRQERTLSVESGTVQCRSSAPLSLPPDFSSGYKARYSSPPYSTLMSARLAQGETKTRTPRSPLFSQSSQSHYSPHLSLNTDSVSVTTLCTSKPPMSPVRPSLSMSLPHQKNPGKQESPKCGVLESDQGDNNHSRDNGKDRHLLLVDNRVQIRPPSLHGDKTDSSSSTYVTETLVYSIKSKVVTAKAAPKDTTPNVLQHITNAPVSMGTKLSQQSHTVQDKGAAGELCRHSGQSSSSSSSTESQSQENESSSKRIKENIMGKSRFFSVEVGDEQSIKRIRFARKKSDSTPNSSSSRSESDRVKSNNKMQVFNKLKQKFSTRRPASQIPSVSGSSDVSSVSDISAESSKTVEEAVPEKLMVLNDSKETEGTNKMTQNRYILIPSSAVRSTEAGNLHSSWSEKSTSETAQDEQNVCAEHMSEKKPPVYLTVQRPTTEKFDFYKDETDSEATNQFLSCRDPSPNRSPDPSATYSTSFRRSTPSPRSPFSPFSSLSPISPFSSSDVTDDSVFYSPKLNRRRESPSPCEPGEGISLGSSRRSRASTGPPCASPGQDQENLASSYADLKYGIEPGRSFSVRSVLSSRPSGPGRISTGSRFMSVGDLSQSVLSCGSNSRDLDQWSVTPDWSTETDCQATNDGRKAYFPGDPGKLRSRSLPRSLTRRLANWSSGDSPSQPVNTTASMPARLRSPNMNICHFAWDTDGPPTPPPTPPLSPVSRRMSKPPSLSSPTFPSSSGALQPADSQSSRGHLPSRSYASSLSTFDESSDCSSDTTTDDEYYLETDNDGEKETEL